MNIPSKLRTSCFSALYLIAFIYLISFNALAAESSQIKALDRYVEIIDAEVKKYAAKPLNSSKLKIFYAESWDANARLLPVKKEVPESAAMVYHVLVDGDKVLYMSQFPMSESGDWAARTAYYFSKDRKLRVLVSSVQMIDQNCALNGKDYQNIDRATSLYFDDDFAILKAMTKYTDVNGMLLDLKNKECSVPIYLPFTVYSTIGNLPDTLWEAVNAQKVSKPLKKSKLNASCLLVIDGVTHMNSDCKLEKDNDGSYFFNDERMIITCPNGKNIDESNCSGHEMIVFKKGFSA